MNETIGPPVILPSGKIWQVGHGRQLSLGPQGHLMAIINVTPDSFSDGGRHQGVEEAVSHALRCVEEGAVILDIGGESTRPGATPVSPEEEQARVLPVIGALRAATDALISIDTYRASTAQLAVEAGAHIVNDVYGLRHDPQMAQVVAQSGAGLVMMHTGRGREAEKLADLIADQQLFFKTSLALADAAGIARDRIVLDPGFGFAKNATEDFSLMARFEELQALGLPLLAGTSRKRFIGSSTGREAPDARDVGTAATTALLRIGGAAIVRVHAVPANRDALRIADAVLAAGARPGESH
ncbi:dihydropteroate synthase [Rhizobium sp. SAFR-030]|uniref:dihydropteroate synthase n=1 Tax=Rhizobium sp. SAFR-030 TaxID=3387277 RepID=UPI003F7E6D13